ncbi:MAG: hypothetical protein H0X04_00205 [Chthoniobacterales bacterium]|nr:hypothetical protein [Chthoniobacterales bacterium]
MTKINREALFALHKQICAECLVIMEMKNRDYAGHKADADPFANFRDSGTLLNMHPGKGLLIRVIDKFKRITSFIDAGTLAVKDEPVQDAIKDIINYMVLLYGMIEDEKRAEWPTPTKPGDAGEW